MKFQLKEVVKQASPQKPVTVTVPSHWLVEYEGSDREVSVQICYYTQDSDSVQFHTMEHGPSYRVSSGQEVEVKDPAMFATPRLHYRGQNYNGVGIE
jgi:hypothetical protein